MRYENFRTIIYVNQFPYFKGSQDKNPRVLLINLYGNHCWYTALHENHSRSQRSSKPTHGIYHEPIKWKCSSNVFLGALIVQEN